MSSPRAVLWVVLLATSALIVLRSFVFLHYEQADFDSDQAIVGLMAKHVSEGRAWPLFFYGQLYMLGVQAWMAAPVFLVLGPTVLAVKLPLLVLNVVTGVLLVWLLVREVGLRPWQAGVAGLWFAALPPITASRLVQAQGGTIEPLLYALTLWMLRARPVAFGLVFAIGFLQREFTLFAVIALAVLDVWTRALFTRRRLAHWLVVLLVFLGVREVVGQARGQASMFGPQTAPIDMTAGVDNVDYVAGSVCLAPMHVAGNVAYLLAHNVPTFFGVREQPPDILIATRAPTGVPLAAPWLVLAIVSAGIVVVQGIARSKAGRVRRLRPEHDAGPTVHDDGAAAAQPGADVPGLHQRGAGELERTGLHLRQGYGAHVSPCVTPRPIDVPAPGADVPGLHQRVGSGPVQPARSTTLAWFLLLTGLLALAGVATGCDVRSIITIRYHLMLALAPVGLVALAFASTSPADRRTDVPQPAAGDDRRPLRRRGSPIWPRLMVAGVLGWASIMLWSSLALVLEYRRTPPPSPFRELADDLAAHGHVHGWASYWVAYHVDFLARERVQLSPTSAIRITDYARRAHQAGASRVVVSDQPCHRGRSVARWHVCPAE